MVCYRKDLGNSSSRYHADGFFRSMITMWLLFFMGLLSGCAAIQPIPAPTSPGSAMIVLEAKLVGNSWRNKAPRPPTHVYLKRTGERTKIKETARNKSYFFYANVPPGRYQVDAAELVMKGGTVQMVGVVEGSFKTPEIRTWFSFSTEIRRLTSLTVKAGTVSYMGEFTGKYAHNPKLFQQSTLYKWEVLGTSGQRTREGELRAFEFMKKKHPDSGWAKKLK